MRYFSRIYLYPVSLLELSSQLTPEMQPFVSFCPFDLRSYLIRFFSLIHEKRSEEVNFERNDIAMKMHQSAKNFFSRHQFFLLFQKSGEKV